MEILRNKITLKIVRKLNKALLCGKEESRNMEKHFKSKKVYNYVNLCEVL